MRSIGKRNIKKLHQIVLDAYQDNRRVTDDEVIAMLPVGWWDIWESADAEIQRLVSDELIDLSGEVCRG